MKRNLLRVISLMTVLFAMLSISGCSKMELTGTLKVTVYEPTKEHTILVYPWGEGGKSIKQGVIEKGGDRSITFKLNMGNYTVDCDGYTKSVQVRPGEEVELILKIKYSRSCVSMAHDLFVYYISENICTFGSLNR